MQNFVPYEKMSKRQKREHDKQRRTVWMIDPKTRVVQNNYKERKAGLKAQP